MRAKHSKSQSLVTKQIFIATVLACVVSIYFIYYAFFGSKGVARYFRLKKELQEKELVKENLENKMENKQNMVNGMNLESLDLDLLDEEARKNLGYANKDEIVIYNEKKDQTKQNQEEVKQ